MKAIVYLKSVHRGDLLKIGEMRWPDMPIELLPKDLKFDVNSEFIKRQANIEGTPLADVEFPSQVIFRLKTLSPIGDAMYVCDLNEYFGKDLIN